MRYIISLLVAIPYAAMAEVPRVVTDLPPVHSLVAQVMGDLGQPVLLLEKGANAHSFQLRPSQAVNLQEADMVVWIGPQMTPWLDRALDGISTAEQLRLIETTGTHLRRFVPEDDHDEAHAEEGQDDDHQHDDHQHGGTDPHVWLDPNNASLWLDKIAVDLGRIDPENAATYTANAANARADLARLDAELAATLTPAKGRPLVVYHDAYGYFADHYGLTIAASVAMGDASGPGAKHIASIEALLRQGPVCLFPEANHDPKLIAQLADATGLVPAAALDPEGANLKPGAALYGQMLRELAQAITDCAP